ncbi:RAS-related protein RABa4d-like protein [Blastocystis sp. subtype 4]|uniref:RAS-related protein RABa4d-like protein n=1 Tax=Blastocystis sp. subtype 4 TaxID=944170 RepID=UPI0007113DBA|nr:RAS-related protein RABa4d-like protein [Blastocystis sp. subtype 4]KNB44280.1 RAS-related protein RABa4d-like protein [Blastocystis sp. subtype 4]|eukprot:XP_014527723.1 RAS-related protein RABa4d-like protein [Blastocystis sp. subtype 4]
MSSYVFKGKMVIVGDIAVGKTSLASRFVDDKFTKNHIASVGVAYFTKTLVVDDKLTVKFDIWDTAGQERYRSINQLYYRGAAAAVIVFDLTQRSTFDAVKADWLDSIRKCADENIIIIIAGNKCDMVQDRCVPKEDIDKFCKEENLMYVETSALSGAGVSDVFTRIALLVKEYMETNKPSGFQLVEVKNNLSDKVYGIKSVFHVDLWNRNLQKRKVAVVNS